MYAIIVSIFCIFSSIYGNWDPTDLIQEADISKIQNETFVSAKNQIFHAAKGSWCSEEKVNLIMDLIALTQPTVCVEIGVWDGGSLIPIAQALKYNNNGKVYAIDAWANDWATKYLEDKDPNKPWWSTVDMQQIYQIYKNRMKSLQLEPFCVEIRKPSLEAVNELPEIDFLHIDGDFSSKGTLLDIQAYIPKVKTGGYILFSNVFLMANSLQYKADGFMELIENCEIISSIDNDNAVLFQKI